MIMPRHMLMLLQFCKRRRYSPIAPLLSPQLQEA